MASETQEPVAAEGQSVKVLGLKVNKKKAVEIVKGAALAYVGFKLGVATLKFIGRRLGGGKRGPQQGAPGQQARGGAASSAAAAVNTEPGDDTWNVVDSPAPPIPDGYKPVATAVLPCTPQELYNVLISGAAGGTELYLKQHRDIGRQWELAATGWRRAAAAAGVEGAPAPAAEPAPDHSLLGTKSPFEWVYGVPGSGGYTRVLTFWTPKKPPQTMDTRCVQRQQFCVYRGGVLVFATAMNMLDIPYKECFTVNTAWRIAPGEAPGTCTLSINLKVHFLRRPIVAGIINMTTFRESAAFFNDFAANIAKHLAALRDAAGALLPAPLPLPVPGGAGPLRGVSRASLPAPGSRSGPLVSPFAAMSGALPPTSAGPEAGGGRSLRHTMPAWKQLRALVVFAVLAITILHQLHLGQELAAIRGGGEAAPVPSGRGGGLMSQAGGLVAGALSPVAGAAGSVHMVLQALVDRMAGGRIAMPGGGGGGGGAAQGGAGV
ncbi:hypothetical protein HYH02_003610 [Chlamydomonas schloesseri]|uniref:VASt domain-containing protein n=1 Tax=Chlamydomonas schloesseri TaxID=2026947 RepID=A0A835WR01_9CHLO|nr:hypothetical protein HYH02_003610 [Chlamydomonas schloesseri]|eukprot:KAG2451834.1 hypothetical protein HYH02_003610 [Chlamydomonas schloesseri]